MTKRRAAPFLEKVQSLSGMNHLTDAAKTQLNALRDGVSVTHISIFEARFLPYVTKIYRLGINTSIRTLLDFLTHLPLTVVHRW